MVQEIIDIYRELRKKITPARLKDISVEVIGSYKGKKFAALAGYARLLGIDASGKNLGGLFAKIIQSYHPDKFSGIMDEIESRYAAKDLDGLLRIKSAYLFGSVAPAGEYAFGVDYEESYAYSDEDFGYDEKPAYDDDMMGEDDFGAGDEFPEGHEYGFMEAVSCLFFGGLDRTAGINDLYNLDRELDLSDFEIHDLSGIEHCVNIVSLNLSANNLFKIEALSVLTGLEYLFLSENNISSIDCLSDLRRLKELDISFNEIDDISVLTRLENLVYVNVMGNPIKDTGVIRELSRKGVIVIN